MTQCEETITHGEVSVDPQGLRATGAALDDLRRDLVRADNVIDDEIGYVTGVVSVWRMGTALRALSRLWQDEEHRFQNTLADLRDKVWISANRYEQADAAAAARIGAC
ncbi:type VII secretion target [Hamadaea sp. NPDC051192]|uniref:type VII secretion target n=1 Tax=Hamadaea sp. NPDC051192 TaxID=3154940 RepID=UPI003446028C